MTGRELYNQAIVLLGIDTEDVGYLEELATDCINQLLCDRLYEHNALLRQQVQQPDSAAPRIGELDEEVPYQEMLVRECFPYGLAALLIAEDDRTMFNWLNSEYERRAAFYAPCEETSLRGTFA